MKSVEKKMSKLSVKEVVEPPTPPEGVTIVDNADKLENFHAAISGVSTVAMTVEGMNVSRTGEIAIIALGFESEVGNRTFIFDLLTTDEGLKKDKLDALKTTLESKEIEKVVHDCRFDSDALWEILNIVLDNVFSTWTYAQKVSKLNKRLPLNAALKPYSIPINRTRETLTEINRTRPSYWKQRPISLEIMNCLHGDTAVLLTFRKKLIEAVKAKQSSKEAEIHAASMKAPEEVRDELAYNDTISITPQKMSFVIGSQNAGIGAIESRCGVVLKPYYNTSGEAGFLICAKSESGVTKAKTMLLDRASKF